MTLAPGFVLLPATADVDAAPPRPGYSVSERSCFFCFKDFRLHVPVRERFSLCITGHYPCPYCGYEAEENVAPLSGPVLIEPRRRTELDWQRRALARVLRDRYASLVLQAAEARRLSREGVDGRPAT